MVELKRIEIPGLADAYRRERTLRDSSFANTERKIGPFRIRLMTLRDLSWLDAEGNGWVKPVRWDNQHEAYAHALALIWHLSPGVEMPKNGHSIPTFTGLSMLAKKLWIFLLGAFLDEEKVIRGVARYLDDRFFDSPKPGQSDNPAFERSFAAGPANVVDLFAAGGYSMSEAEIMDLPLDRLWQYGRLITQRLGGSVHNPSDKLKADYMEKRQKGLA